MVMYTFPDFVPNCLTVSVDDVAFDVPEASNFPFLLALYTFIVSPFAIP